MTQVWTSLVALWPTSGTTHYNRNPMRNIYALLTFMTVRVLPTTCQPRTQVCNANFDDFFVMCPNIQVQWTQKKFAVGDLEGLVHTPSADRQRLETPTARSCDRAPLVSSTWAGSMFQPFMHCFRGVPGFLATKEAWTPAFHLILFHFWDWGRRIRGTRSILSR